MTDKKLRDLEKQLKKEPANIPLRLQLAGLYHQVGRTGDAVEQYRAVALAYRDEGRVQQAIAVARSALAVAPNDAELRRLVDNAVAKAAAAAPVGTPPPVGTTTPVGTASAGTALAAPRTSGARVLDAPVAVRELEPMRQFVRPTGALGSSPIDSTPSQRTPSGLFTPTPLPVPMPYHEADPSKVHAMRSLGDDDDHDNDSTDTHGEPTDPVAESGLSKAARRISERLIALSPGIPLPLEGEDLSSELETRKRPKIDAGVLDQLGVPPTGRMPKLEEAEDEPTRPPVSEPGFEPGRVMRAVGRLDDDAWIEEPTDPRDADRPPSGVFDRPLGATVDALAPDGTPLAAPGALGTLPEAMRARLLAAGTSRAIAPGAAIVKEGDAGESVFVVEDGEVRVCKHRLRGPAGSPALEVARLGRGAMFGEIAVMTDRKRHATVEAVGAVRVVEIPRAAIAAAADTNPALAELLDGMVRERLLSNLMAVAPFFAPIAVDRRPEILARFRPRKVAAGTEVIEQGRVRQGLILVVLGTLELSIRRGDGKIVTIAAIGEGAHAGELALMADGPEPATATAVGPCELVVLPAREFYAVVADEPSVWQALRADADRRNADIAAALR